VPMVKPQLKATIEYLEWTGANHLRHATLAGHGEFKSFEQFNVTGISISPSSSIQWRSAPLGSLRSGRPSAANLPAIRSGIEDIGLVQTVFKVKVKHFEVGAHRLAVPLQKIQEANYKVHLTVWGTQRYAPTAPTGVS
jgi:hypothetical protein